MIQFKILPGGFPVYQQYEGDAGIDLAIPYDLTMLPESSELIELKIAVKIPEGWVGLLTNRSSIGTKKDCLGMLGVIDSGYIGELKFKLFNHSNAYHTLNRGDRVAQLVVVPFYQAGYEYVEALEETERGGHGFGSTGR
ncbi:dUTP diphosphatase [bacterium]|nr:dUTP diphosphatase [bacterium]